MRVQAVPKVNAQAFTLIQYTGENQSEMMREYFVHRGYKSVSLNGVTLTMTASWWSGVETDTEELTKGMWVCIGPTGARSIHTDAVIRSRFDFVVEAPIDGTIQED